MNIPDWVKEEIGFLHPRSVARNLMLSLTDVIIEECDPNFEHPKASDRFNTWVRTLTNNELIDFAAIVLKRVDEL